MTVNAVLRRQSNGSSPCGGEVALNDATTSTRGNENENCQQTSKNPKGGATAAIELPSMRPGGKAGGGRRSPKSRASGGSRNTTSSVRFKNCIIPLFLFCKCLYFGPLCSVIVIAPSFIDGNW